MRFLWNLLSPFLLMGMVSTFAEGASALATVGGGGEEGGGSESTETTESTDGSEGGEGTEGTESTEGVAEGTDGTEGGKPEKIDLRTITPEVKLHLQEIAKTNPKLANQLQNALYTSQTFLKEFPGGLKEARALKGQIDEFGGLEEITKVRTEYQTHVEAQERLDGMARNGDPMAIEEFAKIAGADGFGKLMPIALDRWAQQNPGEYNHTVGKVLVAAMQEGGMVQDLNLAFKMLSLNNPEATKVAIESLKKVSDFVNKIGDIAAKAPERPKVDPEIANQQKELENQREQIFKDKFGSAFAPWRDSKILGELKGIAPSRQFSEFQQKTFGQAVVADIQRVLTSDAKYLKDLNRIYASRNMDELLNFTRTRTEKLLPEAARRVFNELFKQPGAAGKKPAPGAKPGQKAPITPGTAGGAGAPKAWAKVDPKAAPGPQDIDNTKTTFEMKFNKQAILKDGRKVYWGNRVPKA